MSELGLLSAEDREPREQQRAIQRGDALVGFDGQCRGEYERPIGARLDVGGPLRLLLGGQQDTRRGRSLEVEPFARRDDVRTGERHDEVRRALAFGQRLAGAETSQHPHSVLNGGGAVLRGDDFDRPMSVKGLERVGSSHVDGATSGEDRASRSTHTPLTGISRFSNKLRLSSRPGSPPEFGP